MIDPFPGSFLEHHLASVRADGDAHGLEVQRAAARALPDVGGSAALLHRYSNNSPQGASEGGYKLRKKATVLRGQIGHAQPATITADGVGEGVDTEGRGWSLGEDGKTWEKVLGSATSAERKKAFALRRNVESFTAHYRHEQCAFLTLTAADKDISPKEFGRIWDDMRKTGRGHKGMPWLLSYVRVIEAQKRGTPHYHLVIATPFNLHPESFDWDALRGSYEARKAGDFARAKALTKQYANSATPELRALWSEVRAICEAYGLGRSEILPLRKEAGAVAHYGGKYLESGLNYRRDEWKGVRRVEYDRKAS